MIKFACPECDGKLKVAPTAAGKKIKCPKCAAIVLVPAEEGMGAIESSAGPATPELRKTSGPKDAPKTPLYEGADESEKDDDERPRSKKKGKRVLILGLIGGGAVAVLGLIVFLAIFMTSGDKPSATPVSSVAPKETPKPAEPREAIVGTWRSGELLVEYRRDGTMTIFTPRGGAAEGTYKFLDAATVQSNVRLFNTDHQFKFRVSVSETSLTETEEDGRKKEYVREAKPLHALVPPPRPVTPNIPMPLGKADVVDLSGAQVTVKNPNWADFTVNYRFLNGPPDPDKWYTCEVIIKKFPGKFTIRSVQGKNLNADGKFAGTLAIFAGADKSSYECYVTISDREKGVASRISSIVSGPMSKN